MKNLIKNILIKSKAKVKAVLVAPLQWFMDFYLNLEPISDKANRRLAVGVFILFTAICIGFIYLAFCLATGKKLPFLK